MNNSIGWKFPPTNGGRIDGYNDPGIAHFSGAPLSSLARETIQNSLDARMPNEEPVHVSFELVDLKPTDLGGVELKGAIDACIRVPRNDVTVRDALATAKKSITRQQIPCLRVSDRNTTGLRGDNWRALVKMQGVSHKPDQLGAGGSHGVGKYAPFSVSALRTVFYWSCYQENGNDIEKFQGKSVLMSHEGEHGETQGTGFYGIKNDCSELGVKQIPKCFRLETPEGNPVHGTSLVVTSFRATEDWRRRVATSVIENFFYAISVGGLTVIIEPGNSAADSDLFEIEKNSLGEWFDHLGRPDDSGDDATDEYSRGLMQAKTFWELSKSSEPTSEKQDQDLGHCRLWVQVAEGLPRKVGFVRQTGMLITTQQRNLIRFPGFRDFSALCVFEDPEGNELLRRMENPKHDQFEPERLPESDRNRGRRALRRITTWIRQEIRKHAGPPEGGKKTVLSELAAYLPDFQPEEPFEDNVATSSGTHEPGFGEQLTVALKPIRRPRPASMPSEKGEPMEKGGGDGNDTGEAGGGPTGDGGGTGGTGGSGEGDGTGGTGTRGDGNHSKSIPISSVRILPVNEDQNRYKLSFHSESVGTVRLALEEAGDSTAIRRDDVRAVSDDDSLNCVQLIKGGRTIVEVTADAPIGGRSWRLSAVATKGNFE